MFSNYLILLPLLPYLIISFKAFKGQNGVVPFLFLIAGISFMVREFTYIKIGFIYITEFILSILIITFTLKILLRKKISNLINPKIKVALLFLLGYQSWGLLRLIYDLLFFQPAATSESDILTILRNFSLVYYSIFTYLMFFLLDKETEKKIEWFFKTILFFNLFRNILIILMYLIGLESYIPKDGGIIGGHPSLISVFSSLISLYFWFRYKNFNFLILSSISIFFVILSGHRSAVISLVLSLIVFLYLSGEFSLKKIIFVFSFSFIVYFLFIISFSISFIFPLALERIIFNFYSLFLYKLDDPNANWRYLYWSNVINALSKNPIGLGFSYSLSNLAPWEVWFDNPREIFFRSSVRLDPHNSYIAILARLGLIGFSFFFIFLLLTFLFLLKSLKIKNDQKYLLLASFSNFTAIFLFAFFNVTLENPYHGIFFWIWLGILLILSTNRIK